MKPKIDLETFIFFYISVKSFFPQILLESDAFCVKPARVFQTHANFWTNWNHFLHPGGSYIKIEQQLKNDPVLHKPSVWE